MAHRGIWLAATACLVAGALSAPPASDHVAATACSQAAAETSYVPSGGPTVARQSPPPIPAPSASAPAAELPPVDPAVPDLVSPAPRPQTQATSRPVTNTVTQPTKPEPDKPSKPAKPSKPSKPKPPDPPVKPKPTKPKPTIPPAKPGPPDTSQGTNWQGKLIVRTTEDGKTAISGTKPRIGG